jgi:hypothetical protein
LAEGSIEDSTPGLWSDIELAGIRMSPSNPGMGEMKLSKSCIQVIGIRDLKETMKTKLGWAPYRVSFYLDMVRAHLLVRRPCGYVLKYFS